MQSQVTKYSGKVLEYYSLDSKSSSSFPTVVFIHGILSSGRLFTHQLMPLIANSGFSSYSLTLRGHGNHQAKYSSSPFQDHVSDVVAFVDFVHQQEKKPVVLVGYSLGGLIVQHACQHETLKGKLAGVALLASVPPQGFSQLNQTMLLENPALAMVLGQVMAMPNMALLNPYYQHVMIDALFASKPNQQQLAMLMSELKAEDLRLFIESHTIDDNAQLSLPVTVIGAKEDKLVPVSLVEASAEYYGVDPVFFSPMGHAMPLEKEADQLALYLAKWCRTL
ncbi:alpha/beta fold hydrolase [Photobacterium sp. BZF1]|uniref:alpha/beta hydrolase n=1 Tax=Photobacterium sp. BZF1 TaxID=1904457 RepID=UPI0016539874|nr:alpha/beta hydrolase [Photobacterium sp. BZF1]MBC7006065.1 alpha/beta fold hydrolase [Photobacterium sp. BZF1]